MPGFSNYAEDKILDHVFGATAYTAPASRHIRLHTGPPGETAGSNLATEGTRKAVTFGASTAGAISSNAQVQWTAYNAGGAGATETVTHWSMWDAAGTGSPPVGGNVLATGPLGGIAPFTASVDAANETFTAQAHGLAVGNTVEVYALPGNTLPAGLAADTAYTVATAPTSSTFTLTGVNVTASGTCVVQRYVGKVVNDGDTVTIASGQVTIYAD